MMQGLLDFIKTPEGQGLLSGVFGYAANARRGTPINNLGRGGVAGLLGYSNALERQDQQAENQFQRQYRNMQMDQMRGQLERQRAQDDWRKNLPTIMSQSQTTYGAGDEGPTINRGNPQALQEYLMRPESPFADDLIKRQLFPEKPKYMTVKPGETVLNENNPTVPLFSLPADPKTDSKITQYEYAKANGYKGTFEQFVTLGPALMAAAQAPLRAAQIDSIQGNDAYKLPQPSSTGVTVTTPDGQVFRFPDQKSANSFKMKAGIK